MQGWSNDRLPGACRQRRLLTARLLACFARWGYSPVAPPALERYDDLARGLSEEDRRRCVRFVAPPDGRLLALRADVTPQIARMVAQQVGGALPDDGVVRVAYSAAVVRHPSGSADRPEVHQVGVELIGDGHAAADVEFVTLCHEALRAVGLSGHRIDLSHTGVASAMLDALGLPAALRTKVRTKLAHKDRDGLAALLHGRADAAVVASLCDRFGPPAVLDGARQALAAAATAVDRLATIATELHDSSDVSLTVDLGEVRGDDYYTGLRMRAWAPGVSRPIVAGGRYDGLLQHYGVAMPAVGFAIDVDALEAALAHADGGAKSEGGEACLVGVIVGNDGDGDRRRAAQVAAHVRQTGRSAWTQVVADDTRAQALATVAGADSLTVIEGANQRHYTRNAGQWQQSDEEKK